MSKVCGPDCWRDCDSCIHFAKHEESDKWGGCGKHNRTVAIYETCGDFECRLLSERQDPKEAPHV